MTIDHIVNVVHVGCGMIFVDQIGPALAHERRLGHVGSIDVVATSSASLIRNIQSQEAAIRRNYPDQVDAFTPHPSFDTNPDLIDREGYTRIIDKMAPGGLVIVATPDQYHYKMVGYALEKGQHVLCVKPLVHTFSEHKTLVDLAIERGVMLMEEYHKWQDNRVLVAKTLFDQGKFGKFRIGHATMMEGADYLDSNFGKWFKPELNDPTSYVANHYLHQAIFLTGEKPVCVAVVPVMPGGKFGRFHDGSSGIMWTNATYTFEGGGVLTIQNGLAHPSQAAESNMQGIWLVCELPNGKTTSLRHVDTRNDITYVLADGPHHMSPDYMRHVKVDPFTLGLSADQLGDGLAPIGYGYRSIRDAVAIVRFIEDQVKGQSRESSLGRRRALLQELDNRGLVPTSTNTLPVSLAIEAGRESCRTGGMPYEIVYGDNPHIRPQQSRSLW